jgi:hypothetical protein
VDPQSEASKAQPTHQPPKHQINTNTSTYKFLDNTMEDDTLKVSALCVPDKVLDCFGRMFREEPEVDITHACMNHSRCSERDCGFPGLGRGDSLLFTCGLFVENIAVSAEFVVSVALEVS